MHENCDRLLVQKEMTGNLYKQERGGCEEKEICTQRPKRRETVGEFPLVPFSGLLDLDYLRRQNYLLEKIVAWASQRSSCSQTPPISNTDLASWCDVRDMEGGREGVPEQPESAAQRCAEAPEGRDAVKTLRSVIMSVSARKMKAQELLVMSDKRRE